MVFALLAVAGLSRLVLFTDENHWILKGENSRYFYQEVHAWLAKYLAEP
jgi:dipeptidyl aminopeptidase/acylaminoacyl peptidase